MGARRGTTTTSRNNRIAGGLLAAAVAAGTAYAVPATADAAPPAASAGHHLSPRLAALAAGTDDRAPTASGAQLAPLETGPGSLLRTPDGRQVVVDVRLSSFDAAEVDAVKDAGGRIIARTPELRQVTVAVAPDDLTALAGATGVEYVGEELTPQVNACDTTISEGDAILKANQLRATGVDGTGVKVGVISDSYAKKASPFTTAAQDIVSDDLPGSANTCAHTTVSTVADPSGAGTDEGRAMMQIVHDLAPGSPLDFATAFISEPSFASNITALANQGAKAIVDDVTYFDEPMYQDGIVEKAVTGVRAQGVGYFSSSANNRLILNNHEVGSYEAVNGYRPMACPAFITGHADCHNFGSAGAPDSTFTYLPVNGASIRAIMNWAEPWFGVNTDLDLYIVDQTVGQILAGSTTGNAGAGGSQQTFEFLSGTQNNPSGDQWAIVVARKSAAAPATTPRFKIVFANNGGQPFSTLEREVPTGGTGDVMGPTAFGHNGGADAMSVGASDVRVASSLNTYSSYGPVTTLFAPVNGTTPAAPLASPRVVNKPDLVASDCNVTTFFAGAGPPFHFCGTSAAAPHAAAVFALLRQKYPSRPTESINAAMASTGALIPGGTQPMEGGGLLDAIAADTALATTPAPGQPALSGTDPASPNPSTTPRVKGTAVAGSTVSLYTNAACSGSPVATGTAAELASPGIAVTVAAGSTTTFHATATNIGGVSACSTSSVSYTQAVPPIPPPATAPDTVITKAPKKTVKTTKRKAKVSFEFTSTIAGSSFACSIDGKAFASCTSGATFKLKAGQHTFAVRATAGGVTDPTPATYQFKVKRKKHH